jgi:hypothetical protein
MVEYDIKRGWYKNVEGGKLKELMEEHFGEVVEDRDLLVASFGAIKRLEVKLIGKANIHLVTESDTNVSDSSVLETKKRLNNFVEAATGFNAKQRMKRAQQKAKEGKL